MGVGTHFFVYDAVVSHFSRSSNVTADVTCKHCFMALCSCVTESERLHRNSGLEQGWPVSTSVKPLRQTHHPPAFDVCKNGCSHRNDQRVLPDPVERRKGGSSYAWEGGFSENPIFYLPIHHNPALKESSRKLVQCFALRLCGLQVKSRNILGKT